MKFQYNVTKMPQDNLIEKRGFCGIFQEETMYLVNALNVIDEVKKAVIGKDSCVEMVMMAILARGHILIRISRVWERPRWHWHFQEHVP